MTTASALLESLIAQGLDLRIEGAAIRVTPSKLLTEDSRASIKANKALLMAALRNRHIARKAALGPRVAALMVCLRRFYISKGTWKNEAQHWRELHQRLDEVIIAWGYDLENAIDHYERLAPEPAYFCRCKCRAPFCACKPPD